MGNWQDFRNENCNFSGITKMKILGIVFAFIMMCIYGHQACAGADEEYCINGMNAESCYLAGRAYLNGLNRRQSDDQAKRYLGLACDRGHALACEMLGDMYAPWYYYNFWEKLKSSKQKAKIYYGKACDLGRQHSCEYYAYLN